VLGFGRATEFIEAQDALADAGSAVVMDVRPILTSPSSVIVWRRLGLLGRCPLLWLRLAQAEGFTLQRSFAVLEPVTLLRMLCLGQERLEAPDLGGCLLMLRTSAARLLSAEVAAAAVRCRSVASGARQAAAGRPWA
jgi:hypothetical protein